MAFVPMSHRVLMRALFLLFVMFAAGNGTSTQAWAGDLVLPCLTFPPQTTGAYLEERVQIEREEVVLAGRMLVPNRPGPHPAVIIIAGGGRGSQINYTPRFIATRLARCGLAVLIYDKRGTGLSGGDWIRTTYDDLIDDAVAALRILRSDPRVDARRTGLVGISQGGRLAPEVAVRAGGVAFLAAASPPFVSPRETRLFALGNLFDRRGYPPYLRAPFLALWRDFLSRVADGSPLHPLDHHRQRLASYLPEALLPPPSSDFERSPLYNSLGVDYSESLRSLTAPFLVLYGARDAIIPVQPSLAHLRRTLPPKARLEVTVVPEVDHAFRYEDARPRYRFEEVILGWVLARAGLGESCEETVSPSNDAEGCSPPLSSAPN